MNLVKNCMLERISGVEWMLWELWVPMTPIMEQTEFLYSSIPKFIMKSQHVNQKQQKSKASQTAFFTQRSADEGSERAVNLRWYICVPTVSVLLIGNGKLARRICWRNDHLHNIRIIHHSLSSRTLFERLLRTCRSETQKGNEDAVHLSWLERRCTYYLLSLVTESFWLWSSTLQKSTCSSCTRITWIGHSLSWYKRT